MIRSVEELNSLWGHISIMGVSRMQLCTGRSQRPEVTVLYQFHFYPATGSATEPGARLAVKRPAALLSQLPTIACRSVHGYTYLFMGLLCACTQTPTLAQKTLLPTDPFPHPPSSNDSSVLQEDQTKRHPLS